MTWSLGFACLCVEIEKNNWKLSQHSNIFIFFRYIHLTVLNVCTRSNHYANDEEWQSTRKWEWQKKGTGEESSNKKWFTSGAQKNVRFIIFHPDIPNESWKSMKIINYQAVDAQFSREFVDTSSTACRALQFGTKYNRMPAKNFHKMHQQKTWK